MFGGIKPPRGEVGLHLFTTLWRRIIPRLPILLQNSVRNAEDYHGVTSLNIAGWHCGNETLDSFYRSHD
jgi:hypothetical protein